MTGKSTTTQAIKDHLEKYFSQYLNIYNADAQQLLKNAELQDKAYELISLIGVMHSLKKMRTNISFSLSKGTSVVFRGKGGPIDRKKWPFIIISHKNNIVGEIWVDIEFISISAGKQTSFKGHLFAKCHELDVVVVKPEVNGRPYPSDIYLAVEAKHRPYSKQLLKELLGVRREMAMRGPPLRNNFPWWTQTIPAHPPSALVSFCSYPNIKKYSSPEEYWGIKMEHLPIGP